MLEPKLKSLSFNPLMRSEDVIRYSGLYQSRPENLAVHIADVSMMSYIIANQLNKFGEGLNIGLLLEKCLIHDLDETLTGDIPRNTKYANDEIKKACDNLQDSVLATIQNYISNKEIVDKVKTAKQGKEGTILKLADMLGVARRVLMELELNGNKSFLKVVEELRDHLIYLSSQKFDEFLPESQEWILSLIKDTRDTLIKLHDDNIQVIEDFSIVENVLKATPYQKDKKSNGKKLN